MNPRVKLIYASRKNNFEKPLQLVFHVKDTDGNDHVATASIPAAIDLLTICDQQGWIRQTGKESVQLSQQVYGNQQRRTQSV